MTQLVTKVGDVIGDWLLGSKKDVKEKIKSEIFTSMKTVKSTAKITGNTEGGEVSERPKSSDGSAYDIGSAGDSDSDSNKKSAKMNMNIQATESASVSTVVDEVEEVVETEVLIKKKNRKEKKKKGYFNMRNESKENRIKDEDKNIIADINKYIDEKDENEGTEKKNSKKIPGSKQKQKQKKKKKSGHKKNDRDGSPRVIFVCSGE